MDLNVGRRGKYLSSFAPKLEGRVLSFGLILGKSFLRHKKSAKRLISYSTFILVEMGLTDLILEDSCELQEKPH